MAGAVPAGEAGDISGVNADGRAGEVRDPALSRRKRTSLLVIDPVNDFLSEGGAAWDLTKSTVKKNDVVQNLARVIDGARAGGVPVLFGPMAYTAEDYENAHLQRRSGINRIMFERKMFLAGSWGADFHPALQPRADEIVLQPHKGCDLFHTDLPHHLERLGITHLVICGMTANLCCESTGRTAGEYGYDITFLSDAIGAENIPAYEASIRVNYPLIANAVMTVEEFLAGLGDARETTAKPEPGDEVRCSDHGKIGTAAEVAEADEEHEGYLRIRRGLVFSKDIFIPLDAIVRRTGQEVFVNVPKLVVGKMGWETLPSHRDHQAKVGPTQREVRHLYHSRSPSMNSR
ncbi:cysteine hydrolase [Streptomyces sp. ISL-99]|uniref:cysteine hydrolase family protein n=1 Tax=Streptomyces sp. ISL-99 TaxID=2819193 RepID=UPI001BE74B54|nr:isochorismatase family cysteine hydrolase [Streptomyces sp. ISL-99]MBT2530477.1 cysteine hydrolase [Streptomyces sp. ISL-99]